MENDKSLIVFQGMNLRRIWYDNEWYFSVIDVIRVLTESLNPRNAWNMLKVRELEYGIELYMFCVQLKLVAEDGKMRETDCANVRNMFRIIQSISSRKAEPFKLWLV